MRSLRMLLLALALTGCGGVIGQAVAAMAEVASDVANVGNAVDLAETGANLYFARHPSPRANDVALLIQSVRGALTVYALASKTGEDMAAAEAALLAEYETLRALLTSLGVLNGDPPGGGAETEAPLPAPFYMPPGTVLLGA